MILNIRRKVKYFVRNLINFLSEGEGKKFPSIKKELENLENKKKVLEFDLEGIRLSIQKEGKEKFEAKIVLDTLKDFTQKVDQIELADRPHLFQYLIKSIFYGKEEIGVDIFYLPKEYISKLKRVRRAGKGEADEHSSLSACNAQAGTSFMCLKNHSKWLPILDNFRTLHLRFENTIMTKN